MSKTQIIINLIKSFTENKISVEQFEKDYMDQYISNEEILPEEIYQIVDWLFSEVESYTNLPLEPTDNPDNYINEDQLRQSAAKALRELKDLQI